MVQIEGKDRISALSDTLLCIILSFLHIYASVRTSVLSKRWRYVWTKVPVLDFSLVDSSNKSSFITFVYKALVLNDAPELKLFHLSNVGVVEEYHVDSWIWSMLRRNVLEVDLCSINRETKLAEGLFVSQKLRVLKLTGKYVLPVSVLYFMLPNLEILHLSGVILEDSLLDIYSVFPRLRELILRNWSRMKILNIHSASLKVLKIMYFRLTTGMQDIVIEAPNLEYLSLSDNVSFYDIKDVSSLVEAKINVCKQNCGMLELFLDIAGVKTLVLSITTIYYGLWILQDDWTEYWNPYPYLTPKCLSSTLKVIKLYDFCGAQGQVTMGEYFLKTAGRLRVMKIHTVHRDAEDEMSALLRLFKSLEYVCPYQLPVLHNLTCLLCICCIILRTWHGWWLGVAQTQLPNKSLGSIMNPYSQILHQSAYCAILRLSNSYEFCGCKEQVKIAEYILRTAAVLG
ncbi:F-box/LRR-repeat protein At3g59190-like [Chenopodium quinoa]|uniref:F-box/LRR-repeat protein At3g59190-like n=1 Tax=Chenopodium quinoa TaxID=63459 RepID=UPI000B78C2D4|nr:F-box/LRR-repeat protein At3g59190-like [Chenopodium quinoa]